MKHFNNYIKYVLLISLAIGCRNKQERNIEFMPDMYESPAYKTYEVAPLSPLQRNTTFLDAMIYEGKLLYLAQQFLPKTPEEEC